MSEDNPTQTGDLGDMPDPKIEPGEPNPGGADALPEEDDTVPADLGPETNPAVEESPDPLKRVLEEGEDTETKATKSSGDDSDEHDEHDESSDKESPA
jgi:hypothetical protein